MEYEDHNYKLKRNNYIFINIESFLANIATQPITVPKCKDE